jgi:SMODS and SLOG-associating 2TM effector domain 1
MSDRTAQFRALYRELRIVDQLRFYNARREEYGAASRQAIWVRNSLLFLSALAGVLGQLPTGTGRAASGVIAALLAALAGAVTAFETLIGFTRLHKLYGDAALSLETAQDDWDTAATNGDTSGEIDRVEQIFRAENGQWGQLAMEGVSKMKIDFKKVDEGEH